MSEAKRILNFDEPECITVMLGKREFKITQQRRGLIEKILRESMSNLDTNNEIQGSMINDVVFANFDDCLPTLCLVFGFEAEGSEQAEVLAHLKEYVTLPSAIEIFENWWVLNRLDDFFLRVGKATLPPYLVRLMEIEPELSAAPTPA